MTVWYFNSSSSNNRLVEQTKTRRGRTKKWKCYNIIITLLSLQEEPTQSLLFEVFYVTLMGEEQFTIRRHSYILTQDHNLRSSRGRRRRRKQFIRGFYINSIHTAAFIGIGGGGGGIAYSGRLIEY